MKSHKVKPMFSVQRYLTTKAKKNLAKLQDRESKRKIKAEIDAKLHTKLIKSQLNVLKQTELEVSEDDIVQHVHSEHCNH
jgi:hypothetical protein